MGLRAFEHRVPDQTVIDVDVMDVVTSHEDAALWVVADCDVLQGYVPETDLRVGVVQFH